MLFRWYFRSCGVFAFDGVPFRTFVIVYIPVCYFVTSVLHARVGGVAVVTKCLLCWCSVATLQLLTYRLEYVVSVVLSSWRAKSRP